MATNLRQKQKAEPIYKNNLSESHFFYDRKILLL